ncbi:HlyD family secretion protein [Sphingobacterium lactis]|uniref:HlyD family secretion protein n=1 Tax=Sphingobacterium lactis TaxID=797291 RepID=UPI003F81F989
MNYKIGLFAISLLGLLSCKSKEEAFDASGSFEAIETIISAEANGTIKSLHVEEGEDLQAGQLVGYIDTVQTYLKIKQLEAQIGAGLSRKPNIPVQLSSLKQQIAHLESERERTRKLVAGDAATPKQLDDIESQILVLRKQLDAQQSSLAITDQRIGKEVAPVEVQIAQLQDQLAKSKIINPIQGTVLTKYVEENEAAMMGKPLYKIADLSEIILRVYISGSQLPQVKIGQKLTVLTDDGNEGYTKTEGVVTWIADKAEFTPKTIQTKDERANLVYAVKVKVKNDGRYKIGMYAEVKF